MHQARPAPTSSLPALADRGRRAAARRLLCIGDVHQIRIVGQGAYLLLALTLSTSSKVFSPLATSRPAYQKDRA